MSKIIDITPKEDRLPSTDLVKSNPFYEILHSFERINNQLEEQNETMINLFRDMKMILDTEEIDFEEIE